MHIGYLVVTIVTFAAATFSGVCAMLRLEVITADMAEAGVPESWLVFPIGTLKVAGGLGLLLGLLGVPLVGTAAAIGLVLYFVCAVYTHVRAAAYSPSFGTANFFLALSTATLVLGLAYRGAW